MKALTTRDGSQGFGSVIYAVERGVVWTEVFTCFEVGIRPHGLPALADSRALVTAALEQGSLLSFKFCKLCSSNAMLFHHSRHERIGRIQFVLKRRPQVLRDFCLDLRSYGGFQVIDHFPKYGWSPGS